MDEAQLVEQLNRSPRFVAIVSGTPADEFPRVVQQRFFENDVAAGILTVEQGKSVLRLCSDRLLGLVIAEEELEQELDPFIPDELDQWVFIFANVEGQGLREFAAKIQDDRSFLDSCMIDIRRMSAEEIDQISERLAEMEEREKPSWQPTEWTPESDAEPDENEEVMELKAAIVLPPDFGEFILEMQSRM